MPADLKLLQLQSLMSADSLCLMCPSDLSSFSKTPFSLKHFFCHSRKFHSESVCLSLNTSCLLLLKGLLRTSSLGVVALPTVIWAFPHWSYLYRTFSLLSFPFLKWLSSVQELTKKQNKQKKKTPQELTCHWQQSQHTSLLHSCHIYCIALSSSLCLMFFSPLSPFYIYITHTLTHTCTRTYTHTHTHSHIHTHTYMHTLVYTHSHTHNAWIHTTDTLTHMYIHSLSHTLTYTHSLIHILLHTHTHISGVYISVDGYLDWLPFLAFINSLFLATNQVVQVSLGQADSGVHTQEL